MKDFARYWFRWAYRARIAGWSRALTLATLSAQALPHARAGYDKAASDVAAADAQAELYVSELSP